jgi:nitroreductase
MDGPKRNWTPNLKAIAGRRSVRAFLDRAVPLDAIEALLEAAARAPSDNNSKPWKVHVLAGSTKARLTETIMAARAGGTPEPAMEYHYYPERWPEPFLGRRRQVGWALYELLGIQKGDRSGSRAWHGRNFDFFGAPVGLALGFEDRTAVQNTLRTPRAALSEFTTFHL